MNTHAMLGGKGTARRGGGKDPLLQAIAPMRGLVNKKVAG